MTDYPHLVESIFRKSSPTAHTHITLLEYQVFLKTFYLDPSLNNNKIVQALGSYSDTEQLQLEAFRNRLLNIG